MKNQAINHSVTESSKQNSKLLTRKQAAEYLGVTSRTLAIWASVKRYNLPYIKVGRLVKYRINDLDDFILERTITQYNPE